MYHISKYKKNNKMYNYSVFGISIRSEIRIPELLPGNGEPEIKVIFGRVPLRVGVTSTHKMNIQINKREVLLNIKDVANYYIKDGSYIIMEPYENVNYNSLRAYLTGVVLGISLLQKGLFTFHGSSIAKDKRCIIFTGNRGAGKSTICAALCKEGYKFLADDISVINLNEKDNPIVKPAFPELRLASDTLKLLGYNYSTFTHRCLEDSKYVISDLGSFKNSDVPLHAIIELNPKSIDKSEIFEISGTEKLMSILNNIYCSALINSMGMNDILFQKALSIAKNTRYFRLSKPINSFTVMEQIKLVDKAVFN